MTLVVCVLGLALLSFVLLSMWAQREREALGLAGGSIVAADDARLAMPTLRSDRLGLIGRPDHLLWSGRVLIPVEQKPNARHPQPSHILQVAAQCVLVQEVYGIRPPYGLLVLANGVQERVPFTPALEARLVETMSRMRELLAADTAPGPRWVAPKCRACGFQYTCWGDACNPHGLGPIAQGRPRPESLRRDRRPRLGQPLGRLLHWYEHRGGQRRSS